MSSPFEVRNKAIERQAGIKLNDPLNCLWWARFSNKRCRDALRLFTIHLTFGHINHHPRLNVLISYVNYLFDNLIKCEPQIIEVLKQEEKAWVEYKEFVIASKVRGVLCKLLEGNPPPALEYYMEFLEFTDEEDITEESGTASYNLREEVQSN